MKKVQIIFVLASLLMGYSTFLKAQTAEDDEMMKVWAEAMTPNDEHAWLKQMEGTWYGEIQHWMAPGTEATMSKGTSTLKMIMGDRYLEETIDGETMEMPYEGRFVTGYDNVQKKYIFFGMDNFGTGFMLGDGNRKGNVLTISATYPDPVTGGETKHRMVTEIIDNDTHSFVMYSFDEKGNEFVTMKGVYKRIKK